MLSRRSAAPASAVVVGLADALPCAVPLSLLGVGGVLSVEPVPQVVGIHDRGLRPALRFERSLSSYVVDVSATLDSEDVASLLGALDQGREHRSVDTLATVSRRDPREHDEPRALEAIVAVDEKAHRLPVIVDRREAPIVPDWCDMRLEAEPLRFQIKHGVGNERPSRRVACVVEELHGIVRHTVLPCALQTG